MGDSFLELLAISAVFLIVSIPAYLLFGDQSDRPSEPPVTLHNLSSVMLLSGNGAWRITIVRRSGYVHDAWEFQGSASSALQTALQKMRQARINDFSILTNSASKFEARAYYESTGRRRTGKYVGGFIITPA